MVLAAALVVLFLYFVFGGKQSAVDKTYNEISEEAKKNNELVPSLAEEGSDKDAAGLLLILIVLLIGFLGVFGNVVNEFVPHLAK